MNNGKTVLCEIGVGPPSMCFSALHWNNPDIEFMLFEPQKEYYAQLIAAAQGRSNVTIHNVAIGDDLGTVQFYDEGTSSSLAGVASPSLQHKGSAVERKSYEVEVARISDYDHGQIDILRVDVEGNEWFALKHLVSRPREIIVEIYNDLATYINPYLYEIMEWARISGYALARIQDADFTFHYTGRFGAATAEAPISGLAADIEQYVELVKQHLLQGYQGRYLGRIPADKYVYTLAAIFRRKEKVIQNLAMWAKREIEVRNKPGNQTLQNLQFFAQVLMDYKDKNLGQPLQKS